VTQDVTTTPRKPLTPRQRLALWERHKGICAICKLPIKAGAKWRDEHLRALGLGGTNDPENRAPVHEACADEKTHGKDGDLAHIAKAKRRKMKHLGIKRARSSFQTNRDGPFKKRIDGSVERRDR
jgi:5-methylcytosine-specific restriction protein A